MPAMKHSLITLSFLLLSSSLYPFSASAETMDQQIDRMERDLQIIQRQLSRGEVSATGGSSDAKLQVRISAIEDEIRNLRGKAEENAFQIRRLNDSFDRMQRDVELRFNDLSRSSGTSPESSDDNMVMDTPSKPLVTGAEESSTPQDNSGEAFATPREHYNHAFRLLNQTKYKEAAQAFDEFTQKYPKDQLVGNAYYWQGETYYIRRDYINAADMFRLGFEALPNGPKAADNLLKLAMSLNALKRDKEACVVLEQLSTKYLKVSKSIATRAVQEQKRIGCKKK